MPDPTKFSRKRRVAHEPFAYALLVLACWVAPLALGGVHFATKLGLAIAVGAAFLSLSLRARISGVPLGLHAFGVVLFGLAFAAVLQAIPLPPFVAALLSPEAHAQYLAAAEHVGASASAWHPLSLNPPATWSEAFRLFGVALAFVLAANLSWRRELRGEAILAAIAWSGGAVLALSALQTLVGQGPLLGMYEPRKELDYMLLTTTFINENHTAGFFNLTAFTALGLSLATESRRIRGAYAALFAALFAASLVSLSRGGLLTSLVGVVAFAVAASRLNQSSKGRRSRRVSQVAIVAGLTLAVVFGYEAVGDTLASIPGLERIGQDHKVEVFASAPVLLRDYPITGVGIGALGDVFARYNTVVPSLEVTHIENLPLDLAASFGLPIAVAVVCWGLYLLVPVFFRSLRKPDTMGAAIGLYIVSLQNLGDFSLSISGVGLPAAAVAGVLVGMDRGARSRRGRKSLGITTRTIPAFAAAGMVAVFALIAAFDQAKYSDAAIDAGFRQRITALSQGENPADTGFGDGWVRDMVWHHPVDEHLYFLEAAAQLKAGRPEASLVWLDASLERAPGAFAPMLVRAELLLSRDNIADGGPAYRQLFERHWNRRAAILDSLLGAGRSSEAVVAGVPVGLGPEDGAAEAAGPDREDAPLLDSEDMPRTAPVDLAVRIKAAGRLDYAAATLRAALDADPYLYEARWELALTHLLARDEDSRQEAQRQGAQLMARHPDRAGGYLVEGMLAERADRKDEALVMFAEASNMEPDSPHAWLGQARILVENEDFDALLPVTGRLRPLVTNKPGLRARYYRLMSIAAEKQGRIDDAILKMEVAVRSNPNSPLNHHRLGQLRLRQYDEFGARAAFQHALRLEPAFPPALRSLEKLRSREGRTSDL